MSHGSASGNRRRRVGDGVLARGLAFLLLWVVLAGVHASDIPAIVIAVPAATWVSLRLLPRSSRRPPLSGIARLALRFPYQSVIAGVDVAVRALAPRMALRPGFVSVPLRLPAGIARDGFTALSSLMPGTLPVGVDEHGSLLVHCLDIDQPVVAQMVKEEALFARATGHV
jgi:multicomponent Na+:H+ antiporter subunit E